MNSPSVEIVEPLTRREMAVLARLAEDKSNREIAELETLALSSVKWYVQQIYSKLGVNRRSEAIERAHELGLLQQTPATSPAKRKNNLPLQLTSFIGRQKEIAQVQHLICQHCLITLTGVGGTGKTRLALQVGSQALGSFRDGVWLVELAPLTDPALVPQTVISALGQVEQPGKAPMAFLADYLQPKQLLLIIDNCEHLVEACAELATALLQSAPRLMILATSREILGVEGETPFRVPPLGMPDPRHLSPLEELAQFEAVQLFVERARVVSPGFALTTDNAAAVAQITQRLDGIPLAIELAAARLRLLSVEQIALRLNDAFRLLTGGSRSVLPRHQTLQALIDWSYNLLSEGERSLLRSLSVFAGGWTLEAAEEVCAGERLAAQNILDLLGQLADKSLIQIAQDATGEMRYRMLETVRQYAHTRLVEAGEAEAIRQHHLAYYLLQAETLEPKLRSREQISTLDYLEGEIDNLRLALEWALHTDIEAELRLAASLQWFWHIRFHWAEAFAWLEQGLAVEAHRRGDLPLAGSRMLIRAKALTCLGFRILQTVLNVTVKAKPFLEEALALYRSSDPQDHRGLAWTLVWLSACRYYEGDLVQVQTLAQESLRLFRETGDPHGMAESLMCLGNCEIDPVQQKKIYQEQLAIDEANGDIEGIATALFHMGLASLIDGNYASACTEYKASLEHFRRVGNPYFVAMGGVFFAISSLFKGDLEHSMLLLEEALTEYQEMADDEGIAFCLFWKCMLAFAQGRYDQVAEFNDEAWRIAQKTRNPATLSNVLYNRARLASLRGDNIAARRFAEEGSNSERELEHPMMLATLALGHLALQDREFAWAGAFWREAIQNLIRGRWRQLLWTAFPLDGLAVLAVRQDKMERAARLFGTRLLRGLAHTLSPIERAWRYADMSAITTAMGEERFSQLREEGYAMTFMQVLALAQEEG